MCMYSYLNGYGDIILRDPRRLGVHYGGGKHAVLLKNPETFAKVSLRYHVWLNARLPLMLVGDRHRGAVQRCNYSSQVVHLATLSPTLPGSSIQDCHLHRWRLRVLLRPDHEPSCRLSVSANQCELEPVSAGPMHSPEHCVHYFGLIERAH